MVVKLADLGDALTTTPALRALRTRWPTGEIDVLTSAEGANALAGLDTIDRIFVADKHQFDNLTGFVAPATVARLLPLLVRLRMRRYDYVLLLHHLTTRFGALKYLMLAASIGAGQTVGLDNGRGWFLDIQVPDLGFGERHEVEYACAVAAAIGAGTAFRQVEIAVDDAVERRAQEALPPSDWIAVHAGGGSYSLARRWPPEAFAAVANELCRRHAARIVLLGTEIDSQANESVAARLDCLSLNLTGQLGVKETAALLARCRLLISNDSGVVHLATAVRTPVVAIFGPSNDRAWGPFPPEAHRIVRVTLPCTPCFYRGTRLGTPQGCPTRDCLKLVSHEMVVAKAEELLSASPEPHGLVASPAPDRVIA